MTSVACPLTEDELDEVLMGEAGPELRAHCAECAPCRGRVAAVSESIGCYNQASMAWSEARSNTFTRDLSRHRTTWRLSAGAARTMAATVLVGVLASMTTGSSLRFDQVRGLGIAAGTRPAVRGFVPDVRAQQIARDNAMLQAIDAELTEPAAASSGFFHGGNDGVGQPAAARDPD